MGRSRKQKDRMNRVKRVRNAAKILVMLKRTLGLIDEDGNEIIKKVAEITVVKQASTFKERKLAEEKKMIEDIAEQDKPGEIVKVTNEKSSVEHVYDTKTMRDQFGNFPVWMNRRHTKKKIKHRATARLKRFNPFWCHSHVPIA